MPQCPHCHKLYKTETTLKTHLNKYHADVQVEAAVISIPEQIIAPVIDEPIQQLEQQLEQQQEEIFDAPTVPEAVSQIIIVEDEAAVPENICGSELFLENVFQISVQPIQSQRIKKAQSALTFSNTYNFEIIGYTKSILSFEQLDSISIKPAILKQDHLMQVQSQQIDPFIEQFDDSQKTFADLYLRSNFGTLQANLVQLDSRLTQFTDQLKLLKFQNDFLGAQTNYELINLNDYKKIGNPQSVAHPQISLNKAFRSKVVSELAIQNYKFSMPTSYTIVMFDIETYNTADQHVVPLSADRSSHIGMVQIIVRKVDSLQNKQEQLEFVLFNGQYTFSKAQFPNVKFVQFANEQSLCNYFVKTFCQFDHKITFLCGFNSSSTIKKGSKQYDKIDYKMIYGYDLAFLISRSTYKLQPVNTQLKADDATFFATVGFKEMPLLYCLDAQVMLRKRLTQKLKNAMIGYQLNHFLGAYDLPHKLNELTYVQIQQAQLNNINIDKLIDYGLYDSRCLFDLIDKTSEFIDIASQIELWNIPLSFVLYETPKNILQVIISRNAIQSNMSPAYQSLTTESKEANRYTGAYTFTEDCYKNKVVSSIICQDYNSLYPSVIRAFNISFETISTTHSPGSVEFTLDDEHFNESDRKVFVIPESQKQGILPKICEQMTNLRSSLKKQMKQFDSKDPRYKVLDQKQLAVKTINNTVYGMAGQSSSPYYIRHLAALVTNQGRYCLKLLQSAVNQLFGPYNNQPRCVLGDTDSVFFIVQDILSLQTPKEQRSAIFYEIQNKLNKFLQESGLPEVIQVESEEFIVAIQAPDAKKSYFRNELSLNNFFSGNDSAIDFILKGISWSKMSDYLRERVKQTIQNRLLMPDMDAKAYIDECVHAEHNKIKQHVANLNIQGIKDYATVHKSTSKQISVKAMFEQFQTLLQFEDKVPTVRMIGCDKQTILYPVQALKANDFQNVDQVNLLQTYISTLTKYFVNSSDSLMLKKQYKNQLTSQQDGSNILIKIETAHNKRLDLLLFNPKQIYENARQDSTKAYHEIITGDRPVRLYFDYDSKVNPFPVSKFQCVLQQTLIKFGITEQVPFRYVLCNRPDKFSAHIYADIVVNRMLMYQIANQMKRFIDDLDLAIYNRNGNESSLRVIGSIKFAKTGQTIDHRFIIPKEHNAHQYFATYTKNIKQLYDIPIFDTKPIFDFNLGSQIADSKIQLAQKLILEKYPQFVINSVSNRLIILDGSHDNYLCPVCNKHHINRNDRRVAATICDQVIKLSCYRTDVKLQIEIPENIDEQQAKYQFDPNLVYKPLQSIYQLNQKYIEYDFQHDNELLCVKSCMGSGKTEQLIKILLRNRSGLIVSSRKTFSNALEARLKQADIDVINYQQHNGRLDPSESVVICQYESLSRVQSNKPFVLILDEVESIIEQIDSNLNVQMKTQNRIQFLNLLQYSQQILAMDGQLKQNTVDILTYLSHKYKRVIVNNYKPYDSAIKTHLFDSKVDVQEFCQLVVHYLRQNKKIWSYCSSKKVIDQVRSYVEQQTGIKIRYYHGQDLQPDYNGETHGLVKDRDFKNISESFKQHQMIICSPTVGAGIDFSEKYFDIGLHLFANSYKQSAFQFTQGMFRVRHISEQTHLFMLRPTSNPYQYGNTDLLWQFKYKDDLPSICDRFALEVHIDTNKKAMRAAAQQIITSNLQFMGFSIDMQDANAQQQQPEMSQKEFNKMSKLIKASNNLSLDDIKSLQFTRDAYNYFVANPQVKQQMILNNQIQAGCSKQIALYQCVMYLEPEIHQFQNNDQDFDRMCLKLVSIRQKFINPLELYKTTQKFIKYKHTFGILLNYSEEQINNILAQKIETIRDQYRIASSNSDYELLEVQQLSRDIQRAYSIYKLPENERPAELEKQNIKNNTNLTLQTVLAPLGIAVTSTCIRQQVNGKRERVYTYKYDQIPYLNQ